MHRESRGGDPCAIAADVPVPGAPVVFPTNFPDEWFYWTGNARIRPLVGSNNFRADLTLALEGTFGGPTGAVVNGDQITFARFRFRVNGGLVPNATYTVTYPFGVKMFVASTTGTINFTEDQGCGATPPACNFASVLPTTNVGPFLKWDATAPAPPAGYIGDANVTHSVTGSPFATNFLRIDGPNVGGPGINTIQTNQFTVTGKTLQRRARRSVDHRPHQLRAGDGRCHRGRSVRTFGRHRNDRRQRNRTAHHDLDQGCDQRPLLCPDPARRRRRAAALYSLHGDGDGQRSHGPRCPGGRRGHGHAGAIQPGDPRPDGECNVERSDGPTLFSRRAEARSSRSAHSAGGVLNVTLTAPPYQVVVTSSKGGTDTLLVDLVP